MTDLTVVDLFAMTTAVVIWFMIISVFTLVSVASWYAIINLCMRLLRPVR